MNDLRVSSSPELLRGFTLHPIHRFGLRRILNPDAVVAEAHPNHLVAATADDDIAHCSQKLAFVNLLRYLHPKIHYS